ncbi:15,16-dihydrobiliverdin:ferredoxin oxidoreductase PebA [Prochlorococcus sp. SS52]|uniref:15,16-dihydrobiliverdin:ferredoxin oxidoreductase n=2 Tax=Prochlorococcaceae TaxID=2881426 RepID=PEBA_PROMA|nr:MULTISPECIES: 15,16-dihydrobiliverdin:ferredoxin oxidoreductase [Prochlorococcus]Q9K4U6.1 RecName: Full=15,16-dihydrobiliverdin:ferredoxin oxidoreductase [Prochlorococcus marinus subsp. marinus str. CCMP1375]CAB95700.1 hypothetical protein [Prochlorococcus marinus]AAQ00793.1 15,16 dihydrobiliverdin:ferredoxin oxidoreductase [Prochlorococcus marinus subsp. marinus str. CCMP1375]KGG10713.1 15,16-dihydrobiliverdin:ferredoxin oxidoreductase PebA [Prochlorococcus marinus str. LG]KGG34848.1 15,16
MNKLMLQDLHNNLKRRIISHGGKPIEVENGMSERFSHKQDTVIKSWLWDVPGFRRWRVTRMDAGDKLQVLNSVAYPAYTNDKPILGIDILWFGLKRKLVAVLDFQPLVQEERYFCRYYKDLQILKNRFVDFNSQKTMKIYDSNKYFSPWVLLYNGSFDDLQCSLAKILDEFLHAYWQVDNNNSREYIKIIPSKVEQLHINYDIYSAERDPAHGLFKSYFGQTWADQFVREFLFPHSHLTAD